MKTYISITCFFCFSFFINAQQTRDKKVLLEVLNLDNYNTNTLELNPSTIKKISKIEEYNYVVEKNNIYELTTKKEYVLKNGKITSHLNVMMPFEYFPEELKTLKTFEYANNTIKITTKEKDNIDEAIYEFNNDKIQKIKLKKMGFTFSYVVEYSNDNSITVLESNYLKNLYNYNITSTTYDGQKTYSIKKENLNATENKITNYEYVYNSDGNIVSTFRLNPKNKASFGATTANTYYTYDNSKLKNYFSSNNRYNGNITSDSRSFTYHKDKNQNWTIKRRNKFLNKKTYLPEYVLRKITYTDGTTTGSIDFNSVAVQNIIQTNGNTHYKITKLRSIVYSTSENSRFKKSFFGENGEHLVALDTINKELLIFENNIQKDSLRFYRATKVIKNLNHGFGYKFKNGTAALYNTSFKGIVDFYNLKFIDDNKSQLIFNRKGDNNTYIISNYNTLKPYEIFPIELYKGEINNTTKNEISNKNNITFKKNINNKTYHLFVNGKGLENLTSYWVNNDLIVFCKSNNKTYQLSNYKNTALNVETKAIELNNTTSTFWYKIPNNQFRVYQNGAAYTMSKNTWSTNTNDLIIYNKAGLKTYVLKDYKNTQIHQIKEAISIKHNSTVNNTKPNNTAKTDFSSCNGDSKCISRNFFNPKVEALQKLTNQEDAYKQYAEYILDFEKQYPGKTFSVLLKTSNIGYYTKAKKYLPQNTVTALTNQANKLMSDYRKHMNSKETKDKIKKNGGTINNN